MKKRLSKLFALIFVLGITVCTAAACNKAGDSVIPPGYTVKVTYYLTDGEFEDYAGKKYLDGYYKPDSKIAEPNVSTESFKCSYKGHSLDGWFIAQTDDEGKVITDADGAPKASEQKFDFSQKLSESITLVSAWSRKLRLTYNNFYMVNGSSLYRNDCEVGKQIPKPTMQCRDSSGEKRDVAGYYWDAEYTNEISFPITYDYLDSLVPEDAEPDSETNYIMLYAYVKYAD